MWTLLLLGLLLTETLALRQLTKTVKNLVLYDGVCKFCNTWVDVCLRVDRQGVLRFAALQSDIGQRALSQCGRQRDDISSIVFIDGPLDTDASSSLNSPLKHYIKSEAVVRIASLLGIPANLFSSLLPMALKDSMYDAVAENRYNIMGKRDSCRLTDPEFDSRFIA
jgi:predicted DCC family thiol-disulfide oxidoreductase YuxK